MCMNPVEVSDLCALVVYHIKRCEDSEKLPALEGPPYVPYEHQRNLTTLACVIEILARRISNVYSRIIAKGLI